MASVGFSPTRMALSAKFSTLFMLHIVLFLFLSLKALSSPPLPFRGRRAFFWLLGSPWDAQFAFLPIDYFLRSLPYSLGGIRCFRVTSFCHPCLFCFGCCSPWESTQFALKRFSGRHLLCGVCGSCLAPSCWSGCFPWPRLFPQAASDGFFQVTPFGFPFG